MNLHVSHVPVPCGVFSVVAFSPLFHVSDDTLCCILLHCQPGSIGSAIIRGFRKLIVSLSVFCVLVFQDLERTAERGRNDAIRPGCSAAFSVHGDEGGELLVLTAELREEQVRFLTAFSPGVLAVFSLNHCCLDIRASTYKEENS